MAKQEKQTALLTGATKGIGRAIAFELAASGYGLLLTARKEADLEALAAVLREHHPGIRVECFACDLSDPDGCTKLLEWAGRHNASVLVNNLGIFRPVSILEETEDDFTQQWQVNYITPHRLARAMAGSMKEKRRGHIIHITSVASRNPVTAAGTYSVTKAALRSLTHVLREELRPHGVRVTEIIPGSTKTASWEGTEIPDARFVMPEDVAKAVRLALQMSDGANMDEVVVTPRLGNI